MGKVYDVIFGSLEADDDEEFDSLLKKLRTRFLAQIQRDAANSSKYYYISEPTEARILSIYDIVQRLANVIIPNKKIREHIQSLTHEQIDHIQYY
ncbi:unnamed protein product, partial [Rotaria sp. Silwood2]